MSFQDKNIENIKSTKPQQSQDSNHSEFQNILSSLRKNNQFVDKQIKRFNKLSVREQNQLHEVFKAQNELAKRGQQYLNTQIKPQVQRAIYTKWKNELEKEMNYIVQTVGDYQRQQQKIYQMAQKHQENESLINEKKNTEVQNQDQDLEKYDNQFYSEVVQERNEKISRMSHAINLVNEMLQEINELVVEQGEQLTMIEDHVHKTCENTNNSVKQIQRARSKQTESKDAQCFVIALIVIVILTLALFISAQ